MQPGGIVHPLHEATLLLARFRLKAVGWIEKPVRPAKLDLRFTLKSCDARSIAENSGHQACDLSSLKWLEDQLVLSGATPVHLYQDC